MPRTSNYYTLKSDPMDILRSTRSCSKQRSTDTNSIWKRKRLKIGDRVGIYWKGDECYYPCTVGRNENNSSRSRFFVQYDDGLSEWTDMAQERWLLQSNSICKKISIGSRVAIYWRERGCYYPCTVEKRDYTALSCSRFFVQYDDGFSEWTNMAQELLLWLDDKDTKDQDQNNEQCMSFNEGNNANKFVNDSDSDSDDNKALSSFVDKYTKKKDVDNEAESNDNKPLATSIPSPTKKTKTAIDRTRYESTETRNNYCKLSTKEACKDTMEKIALHQGVKEKQCPNNAANKCRDNIDPFAIHHKNYSVIFDTTKLGLSIYAVKETCEVIVREVTNAKYKNTIYPQDVITSIGTIKLKSSTTVHDVINLLSSLKRPLTINFVRRKNGYNKNNPICIDVDGEEENIALQGGQGDTNAKYMYGSGRNGNKQEVFDKLAAASAKEEKEVVNVFDDDNEVVIVEKKRKALTNAYKTGSINSIKVDGCIIIGSTGKNFIHARENCVIEPFAVDPSKHCDKCFCYVCDVNASDCTEWDSHCHAKNNERKWKNLRSKIRSRKKAPERELRLLATATTAGSSSTFSHDDLSAKRTRRTKDSNTIN